VILDLVHRGDNLAVGEELTEVFLTVVGDADGADFAGGEERLHVFPGIDVAARPVDIASGAVGEHGEFGVVAVRVVCYGPNVTHAKHQPKFPLSQVPRITGTHQ